MQLAGIHHLTAVTADASKNHAFYTRALGLRLVKKSVNQDDTSAYHLFYADGRGSPGTDITFFDWSVPREKRGTRSIARTAFRVGSESSLDWWAKRFASEGVVHDVIQPLDGHPNLDFEDAEGHRLSLVVDPNPAEPPHPWAKSPVPAPHQILGLGPITLSVPSLEPTDRVLTSVMNMRAARKFLNDDGAAVHVYEMGGGGLGARLHVAVEPNLTPAHPGFGGVHHVAFRTTTREYSAWAEQLRKTGMPTSGPVDRYYFQSLYFREPNGILFEIATDEPGFAVDEAEDTLGERLALPPFLEADRKKIEARLKPLS